MTGARCVNIHATCVLLAGTAFDIPRDAGVLLLGRSGAGKSDLALRLIAMGGKLVSDDRTDLFVQRDRLFARAPKTIRNLMEVRGLGIVTLPCAPKARIALAVTLMAPKARLPERVFYLSPLDLSQPPPLLRLSAFESSAPAKIALAVAAFERKLFRETARRK